MRISTCLRPAALWAWGGCEHPFLQPAWRPAPKFELFHFSPVRSADLSRAGGYAVIKGVCCNTATTTVVAGAWAYATPAPAARWAEPWRAEVSWGVSDAPTNVSGFHGLLLRSLRRLTTTFVSSKHGLSRGRPSCLQHFKLPAPVFSLNIDPSRFRHLLPSIYAPVASSRRAPGLTPLGTRLSSCCVTSAPTVAKGDQTPICPLAVVAGGRTDAAGRKHGRISATFRSAQGHQKNRRSGQLRLTKDAELIQ